MKINRKLEKNFSTVIGNYKPRIDLSDPKADSKFSCSASCKDDQITYTEKAGGC